MKQSCRVDHAARGWPHRVVELNVWEEIGETVVQLTAQEEVSETEL